MKSVSPITRSPLRGVDDDEVVRRHRPQADGVGRIGLVASSSTGRRRGARTLLPTAPRRTSCTSTDAELLVVRERQLERGALHVVEQDVQVVGIDQRVLRRRVEEVRRIADDELIDRRAARDQHRRRSRRCGGRRGRRAATSRRSCPDSRPSPRRRARRCRCRARARWWRPPPAPAPRAGRARSRGAGSADSRRDSRESHRPRPADRETHPSGRS